MLCAAHAVCRIALMPRFALVATGHIPSACSQAWSSCRGPLWPPIWSGSGKQWTRTTFSLRVRTARDGGSTGIWKGEGAPEGGYLYVLPEPFASGTLLLCHRRHLASGALPSCMRYLNARPRQAAIRVQPPAPPRPLCSPCAIPVRAVGRGGPGGSRQPAAAPGTLAALVTWPAVANLLKRLAPWLPS